MRKEQEFFIMEELIDQNCYIRIAGGMSSLCPHCEEYDDDDYDDDYDYMIQGLSNLKRN